MPYTIVFMSGFMSKKNSSTSQKRSIKKKPIDLNSNPDRERRIMNSITNSSVMLMGTMMGAFSDIMIKATGTMASGMAKTLGGEEDVGKINRELIENKPEIDEKMKGMISDMRKDIYSQMKQKEKDIRPLLSESIFNEGPKIIDKYDFKLPKLTEELDDAVLAKYMHLLVSEDQKFEKMFKELMGWMNSLPKLPEKTKYRNLFFL